VSSLTQAFSSFVAKQSPSPPWHVSSAAPRLSFKTAGRVATPLIGCPRVAPRAPPSASRGSNRDTMGKAVPSLSLAAQREEEVRKQLAPSGLRTKWMRGYRGAKRAAARLLARQAPPPAARPTTWTDVPHHVQEAVLWQLGLQDLAACRLAGFGGRDEEWRRRLKRIFLARVRSLRGVERSYVNPGNARRGSGNVAVADGASLRYKPAEFATLDKLFCFTGANIRRAGCPGVPPGIGEMRELVRLEVLGDVVKSLPDGLALCSNLKILGLRGHGFVRVPSVVLQLRQLRVLGLSMCASLSELPERIGEWLPALSRIELNGCSLLRALPESLLPRLESSSYKQPLVVSTDVFPDGYLDRLLSETLYPKLRAKFKVSYPQLQFC
jgi:hypothetical protein